MENCCNMFNKLPVAYANHKMLFDENGVPCDFIFLDTNQKFLEIFPNNPIDIIGKKLSDITSDNDHFKINWIAKYGEAVQKNQDLEFDELIFPINQWFKIYVYPTGNDNFITYLIDITSTVNNSIEKLFLHTTLNEIIYEFDEETTIINVFASDESVLYLPKNELIGKKANALFPKEYWRPFQETFERAKISSKKESIVYNPIKNRDKWYKAEIKYTELKYSSIHNRYIFVVNIIDITEQMALNQKLKESELLFRTIFEQAPIGVALARDYQLFPTINSKFIEIMGWSKEQLLSMKWSEYTHPDDLIESKIRFQKFLSREVSDYSAIKRYIKADGSCVWVRVIIARLDFDDNSKNTPNHVYMIEDITAKIEADKALLESEQDKSIIIANLPGLVYKCKYDKNWTMDFISEGCQALTGYSSESLLHNTEIAYNDIILPEYRNSIWEKWAEAVVKHSSFKEEYEIMTACGDIKWVFEQGQAVYDKFGDVLYLEGHVIDISERKKQELEVKFSNEHDALTGLYNRGYFYHEMNRLDNKKYLPLSVIIGNINGLRLINSALGQSDGDRVLLDTTNAIQSICRKNDILARTGGNEFSLLFPNTDFETASMLGKRIKEKCDSALQLHPNDGLYNSVSFGTHTKTTPKEKILEVYKTASDYMINQKTSDRRVSHIQIMTSIMATLFTKSQETEAHTQRILKLSKMMGTVLSLPNKDFEALELFALLHDVGEIGIADHILNKPDTLNEYEWEIMRKHPELGYKIAISSPVLSFIAEYILTHHERWDGTGYPEGLQGESIPLLSRILSVADAYDAMTENKIYKKAITSEEAIAEINRCSGTQFDPFIVQTFNQVILEINK